MCSTCFSHCSVPSSPRRVTVSHAQPSPHAPGSAGIKPTMGSKWPMVKSIEKIKQPTSRWEAAFSIPRCPDSSLPCYTCPPLTTICLTEFLGSAAVAFQTCMQDSPGKARWLQQPRFPSLRCSRAVPSPCLVFILLAAAEEGHLQPHSANETSRAQRAEDSHHFHTAYLPCSQPYKSIRGKIKKN